MCNYCRTSISGAKIPHTPSARGIHADVRIQRDAMTDILAAPLPRGMLQPEMQFTGVKEEVNGVRLKLQVQYFLNLVKIASLLRYDFIHCTM